jgi:hypothetical protein
MRTAMPPESSPGLYRTLGAAGTSLSLGGRADERPKLLVQSESEWVVMAEPEGNEFCVGMSQSHPRSAQ